MIRTNRARDRFVKISLFNHPLTFAKISGDRMVLEYRLPLNEIVMNFYESLKSITSGFASLNYEHDDYVVSELVRIDFLVNR